MKARYILLAIVVLAVMYYCVSAWQENTLFELTLEPSRIDAFTEDINKNTSLFKVRKISDNKIAVSIRDKPLTLTEQFEEFSPKLKALNIETIECNQGVNKCLCTINSVYNFTLFRMPSNFGGKVTIIAEPFTVTTTDTRQTQFPDEIEQFRRELNNALNFYARNNR